MQSRGTLEMYLLGFILEEQSERFTLIEEWSHASWDNIQGYLCKSSYGEEMSCLSWMEHSTLWMEIHPSEHKCGLPIIAFSFSISSTTMPSSSTVYSTSKLSTISMAKTTGINKAVTDPNNWKTSMDTMKKETVIELSDEEDEEEKGEQKIQITTWRMIQKWIK